jgi:hypothetical protein
MIMARANVPISLETTSEGSYGNRTMGATRTFTGPAFEYESMDFGQQERRDISSQSSFTMISSQLQTKSNPHPEATLSNTE